jgi:cysteine desulfurase/selenocysteine lyase
MPSLFNRADFPMLSQKVNGHSVVYLDSAATSLKPRQVIQAMTRFYEEQYATVHRTAYTLSLAATARYDEVRGHVKRFLGALTSEEIVFTRGTTEGINLIARSLGDLILQEGDEMWISGQEHHSNIVPWQLLCERRKAYLKIIPLKNDGQIDIEEFKKKITSKAKIVSVVHVSNVLGIVNPVEEIIELAHQKGAYVVLDAAQSIVHLKMDVQKLDCDFLVFSAHKLYGPTGIGILYGKQRILESMPPYEGGGDMIQKVTFEKTTYQPPPLRFEAGTPMIAEVIGLGAALDFLNNYSSDEMIEYKKRLLVKALEKLPQEVHILGPIKSKASLLTFHIPGIHPLDLATFLDLEGICIRSGHLCAQPLLRHFGLERAARISFAPYNTEDEIEYFCDALKKTLKKIKA